MAARRSARNTPSPKKRRRGSKGEPSPGVPPLRAAPAARSPCALPWGWRWTKERVVEDADPYGGWETARVPRDILRDRPTPGGSRRNVARSAETAAAGRRGRRPLQGWCGDVGSAIIPRPASRFAPTQRRQQTRGKGRQHAPAPPGPCRARAPMSRRLCIPSKLTRSEAA